LVERWYACIRERLGREVGVSLDGAVGFRTVETATRDGGDFDTLEITGVHSRLYPGVLRDDVIATVTVRPSFFDAVLAGAEVDFRFTRSSEHVLGIELHKPHRRRFVTLVSELCNQAKPWRLETYHRAKSRVEQYGVPERIERVGFSDEVVSRALEQSRPAVLTGVCDDWPALRWTPEHLVEHHAAVSIGTIPCRSLFAVATSGVPRYASGPVPPELLPEFGELPFLKERLCDRLIFAGQAGGRNALHCDFADGFLVQVFGKKTFKFFPPTAEEGVYPMNSFGRSRHCYASMKRPNAVLHPRFMSLVPLEVTVDRGDVLIIPVGWYHAATADETVFSLTTFLRDEHPVASS
jgi:hypothetical protein